jgi:hypothetical protein
MLTRRSTALAFALAAWISASAAAAPVMQYSWDDCSLLVPQRNFTAPAVYTQAVSVLGLDQPIVSFRLIIRIVGPYGGLQADAWHFSDLCQSPPDYCVPFDPVCCPWGGGACQPFGRVSTLLAGTACDTIPGLQVRAHYEQGPTSPAYLIVDGTADGSFVPDPTRRYTLIRMAFDHSGSVAGPSGAGTCGYADWALQFEIGELTLNGLDQRGRITWENCVLAWNGQPGGSYDCPLVVPVMNRTWGQIKTLYR